VKLVATWWRRNRQVAPTLFDDELHAAVETLKLQPMLGPVYRAVDGEVVRRVLLPKTAQHLYYVVDETNGMVVVYTVWGARRGRGPKL
jgi:hypothetical protein